MNFELIFNDSLLTLAFISMYSPDGLQFVSSKDVSAHLLSSFGVQDASHENSGPANESSWLTCRMTSENVSGHYLPCLG